MASKLTASARWSLVRPWTVMKLTPAAWYNNHSQLNFVIMFYQLRPAVSFTQQYLQAVLRIRDVCPGFDFFSSRIPGQTDSRIHIRIRNKEFTYLTQKMVSKLSEIWSGMFIPDPDLHLLPIQDPGVKKAPDPGSGSATLHTRQKVTLTKCGYRWTVTTSFLTVFKTVRTYRYNKKQRSGSMTFWCWSGSGSADPCLWLMDSDPDAYPDPAIFVIDLQDANKTNFKTKAFLLITFWRYIYIIFKDKNPKEVTKQYESRFF